MKQAIEVKVAIVIVLGLLMVTSSVLVMAPTWVMAKKHTRPSTGDSGTDVKERESGKPDTDKGSTDTGTDKGTDTSTPNFGEVAKKAGEQSFPGNGPVKNPVYSVPEKGWVNGKWTGGSQEEFLKGPTSWPEQGPTHGPNGPPGGPHPPTIHQNIIIVIKNRIVHSGGGSHTHTPSGTYWSNADMDTLHMIWNNGIKKGEDPVVDQFMTRMVG